MVRPSYCGKQNVRKGPWTEEEDAKMLAYVSKHGPRNWTAVPRKAGLRRCGKSCRLRWTNYLGPDIKHESFTPEEEDLIIKMHAAIGSRWSLIAQQLPGRTDNDVKNFWNTKLRKKLSEMGIDPVTHRPFSQILADYGTINGTINPNPKTRVGSLGRDLKHAFVLPKPGKDNLNSNIGYIDHHQADESTDLLSHLQAIKFMREASNRAKKDTFLPEFYRGSSVLTSSSLSSSSSSSSTCSTAAQENTEVNFNWCDFLLDEEIFQENQQKTEEPENAFGFFSATMIGESDNVVAQNNGAIQMKDESSSNCFVEAIIAKEKEMFLGFPDYFEQPSYDGSD